VTRSRLTYSATRTQRLAFALRGPGPPTILEGSTYKRGRAPERSCDPHRHQACAFPQLAREKTLARARAQIVRQIRKNYPREIASNRTQKALRRRTTAR